MKSVTSLARRSQQSGSVSIFVVVFAILLMSVVTISFLRIMLNDQSRASSNDLSQSAYDSAQAGVEDGKRAFVWYSAQCAALGESGCRDLADRMATTQCNQALVNVSGVVKAPDVADTSGGTGVGEVHVQQSAADETGASSDAALNQAYTCVTLTLNTDDYVGSLPANQSALVPLITTKPIRSLTVEWFNRDDVANTTGAVSLTSMPGSQQLLAQSSWPSNRPPVVRAQYMQVGGTFTLDSFDYYISSAGATPAQSNTNTLFLYPVGRGGSNSTPFTNNDIRKTSTSPTSPASASSTPYPTQCSSTVTSGGYACKMELGLPEPMGGGTAKNAYLLLSPLYTSAHFRISLQAADGTVAQFKGVQPIVDSTGRASDVFRRVQSRVDLYPTDPYISGAVDVQGDFCKDFGVTDTQYQPGAAGCTP